MIWRNFRMPSAWFLKLTWICSTPIYSWPLDLRSLGKTWSSYIWDRMRMKKNLQDLAVNLKKSSLQVKTIATRKLKPFSKVTIRPQKYLAPSLNLTRELKIGFKGSSNKTKSRFTKDLETWISTFLESKKWKLLKKCWELVTIKKKSSAFLVEVQMKWKLKGKGFQTIVIPKHLDTRRYIFWWQKDSTRGTTNF